MHRPARNGSQISSRWALVSPVQSASMKKMASASEDRPRPPGRGPWSRPATRAERPSLQRPELHLRCGRRTRRRPRSPHGRRHSPTRRRRSLRPSVSSLRAGYDDVDRRSTSSRRSRMGSAGPRRYLATGWSPWGRTRLRMAALGLGHGKFGAERARVHVGTGSLRLPSMAGVGLSPVLHAARDIAGGSATRSAEIEQARTLPADLSLISPTPGSSARSSRLPWRRRSLGGRRPGGDRGTGRRRRLDGAGA